MTFQLDDSVVVKPGTQDPDLDINIGGWQGRVSEINEDNIRIDWDSITLKQMKSSIIIQCEQEGLAWNQMYLFVSDIDPAQPRDTSKDVKKAIDEINKKYYWVGLGDEGLRIQKVLSDIDPGDTLSALGAWEEYLESKLKFPIKAEVVELMRRGVLELGNKVVIHRINDFYDEESGIFVKVSYQGETSHFPLADLEVLDRKSKNYQPIKDYVVWFANQ